jgi:hypothetical protein
LSSFTALNVFTGSDVSQLVRQEEYIAIDSMHKRERFEFYKYKPEYSILRNAQRLGKQEK